MTPLNDPPPLCGPFRPMNLDSERYASLPAAFRFEVQRSSDVLQSLVEEGVIRASHLHGAVVDFGCGFGGSTFVLNKNDAKVTAVERDGRRAEIARKHCSGVGAPVIHGDGIEFLLSLPPNSLDMVSAFMLGPDLLNVWLGDFYAAASHALKPEGIMLATSDYETIANLRNVIPGDRVIFRDYGHAVGCIAGRGQTFSSTLSGSPFGELQLPGLPEDLAEMFEILDSIRGKSRPNSATSLD